MQHKSFDPTLIDLVLAGGLGSIAGAIVGGVNDILAYMRKVFGNQPKDGPEVDYSEQPQPPQARPTLT